MKSDLTITSDAPRDRLARILMATATKCHTWRETSDYYAEADAILVAFPVLGSESEIEWGVLFPDRRAEPSWTGLSEGSARYLAASPPHVTDKHANYGDRVIVVRRAVTAWTPA